LLEMYLLGNTYRVGLHIVYWNICGTYAVEMAVFHRIGRCDKERDVGRGLSGEEGANFPVGCFTSAAANGFTDITWP
ncbi:MAG: hypothetical protein ACPHYC_05260, partial [Schleiferiaceae bacterium]